MEDLRGEPWHDFEHLTHSDLSYLHLILRQLIEKYEAGGLPADMIDHCKGIRGRLVEEIDRCRNYDGTIYLDFPKQA